MYKATRIVSIPLLCSLLVSLAPRATTAQAQCQSSATLYTPTNATDYDYPTDNPIPFQSRHYVYVMFGEFQADYDVNIVAKHLVDNDTVYEIGWPNQPYDQPVTVTTDEEGYASYSWLVESSHWMGIGIFGGGAATWGWCRGPLPSNVSDTYYSVSLTNYFSVDYLY